MLLTETEMNILSQEAAKVAADPNYKSPEMYTVLSHMIRSLYNIKKFTRYPREVLEAAELNGIVKAYKAIASFDIEKASKARADRGLPVDSNKCLHRYLEVVLIRSFITTFEITNSKQLPNKSVVYIDDPDHYIDLAYIEMDDIESRLDAEAKTKRADDFNRRLDSLERYNND